MSFITDMMALSHVPRWVIVRTARQQSVAEHTFRMTMIAVEIFRRCSPPGYFTDWSTVMWHCLTHDADESVTGDVPTPARVLLGVPAGNTGLVEVPTVGDNPEPTQWEMAIIKLADWVEAYVFIRHEGRGTHAGKIGDAIHDKISNHARQWIPPATLDEFFNLVNELLAESEREAVTR